MLDARAKTPADMEVQIMVIRDPFSNWVASPTDLDEYGIVADGQPRRWYLAINFADNEIASYFPSIGSMCKFHLPDIVTKSRPLPTSEFHHDEIAEITRDLFRLLTAAETMRKALHVFLATRPRNLAAEANPILRCSKKSKPTRFDSHYMYEANAAEILHNYVRVPSREVVEQYAEAPADVQRVQTAFMLAARLRQLPGESEFDFSERLAAWVEENDVEPVEETRSEQGEAWDARRIPLPPGTRARLALFSVHTPTQAFWPMRFTKPPCICKLPAHDVVGPLPKYLRDITTVINAGSQATAIPTIKIRGHISYENDDKTVRIESDAVAGMNSISGETIASKFWTHTLDFRAEVPMLNWLDSFPQLRQDIEDGCFKGEHKAAAERLENAPAYMFISGGPGSGKSTFATRLARSVITSDVEVRKVLWTAPQNKMIEDALSRHEELSPEKRVGRMLPWQTEMSALMGTAKPPDTVVYTGQQGTKQDRKLAEYLNTVSAPSTRDASSMSNIARQIAAASPEQWRTFHDMINDLENDDKDEFRNNLVEYKETCRKLLAAAAESCDVICATTVAAAELADHSRSSSPP